jgi:Tfp pilus assembly protein PilV
MKRRKLPRGVTLVEIMIGVFVLSMTIVTTTAMFSSSALLRARSGGFSRAATVVNRKLEQIRKLDAKLITASGLQAAGVIDPPVSGGASYSFNAVDSLTTEFPQAASTLTVTNPGSDLVTVSVSISWRSYRGKQETVTASTYVADKSVWREP